MQRMWKIGMMLCWMMLLTTCGNQSEEFEKAQPFQESESGKEDVKRKNTTMKAAIQNTDFVIELYENDTVSALRKQLPLTMTMRELNGNEKYAYLKEPLPNLPQRFSHIEAGDVMLFGEDCLVIFYESFSTTYAYTPIGHIDDTEALKQALLEDRVNVLFS